MQIVYPMKLLWVRYGVQVYWNLWFGPVWPWNSSIQILVEWWINDCLNDLFKKCVLIQGKYTNTNYVKVSIQPTLHTYIPTYIKLSKMFVWCVLKYGQLSVYLVCHLIIIFYPITQPDISSVSYSQRGERGICFKTIHPDTQAINIKTKLIY